MIGLLQAIETTGSISQAAKICGLSYKGAWQILERANHCAPNTLISTATGGSQGGGARLTLTGRGLLALYQNMQLQHRDFLQQLNRNLQSHPEAALLLQRLAVKTSVRNQLFGKVRSIEPGAVNATVTIVLSGDMAATVSITQLTLLGLNLKPDLDAVLLINGNEILLSAENDKAQYSASNRFPGTIIQVQDDDIHSVVTILLANGETLTGVITRNSARELAFDIGSRVFALFKANAPILGLKAEA